MTGSEFIKTLPEQASEERDKLILDAILAGHHPPIVWSPVPVRMTFVEDGSIGKPESTKKILEGTVFVSSTPIAVGTVDDHIFVNVSHVTAEKIAQHFDAFLPTPKIVDATYDAATVKLEPQLQRPDASMANTSRTVRHNRDLEVARAGRCGLVRPFGKAWVTTNKLEGRPGRAANYGWHSTKAKYQPVMELFVDGKRVKVWQPVGLAHSKIFTDYSEMTVDIIRKDMIVGRNVLDYEEVAVDPLMCWLVSTEGPMRLLRHPAVTLEQSPPAPPKADTDTDPVIPIPAIPPLFHRTLRLMSPYMVGDDVAAMQRMIATVGADGVFGEKTEKRVMLWQAKHGLSDDGIFGEKSRRKARDLIGDPSTGDVKPVIPPDLRFSEFDLSAIKLFPATNYTWANRDSVMVIVLHSAEIVEKPSSAEALASWVSSQHAPRASWHYAIDNDSITQSVSEEHVAWHAPGMNRLGIGIEHAGYARQSAAEWLDEYSAQMLYLSAMLVAKVTCPRWSIPVDNFVKAEGLRAGYDLHAAGKPIPNDYRGFTTHHEVTKAKIKKGSHVDPGAEFPIDHYLDMVARNS